MPTTTLGSHLLPGRRRDRQARARVTRQDQIERVQLINSLKVIRFLGHQGGTSRVPPLVALMLSTMYRGIRFVVGHSLFPSPTGAVRTVGKMLEGTDTRSPVLHIEGEASRLRAATEIGLTRTIDISENGDNTSPELLRARLTACEEVLEEKIRERSEALEGLWCRPSLSERRYCSR